MLPTIPPMRSATRHNPTQRAHTWARAMSMLLATSVIVLLVLMVLSLVSSPNPLPSVIITAGLVLICFFYAYIFVLPDDLTSTATDRTLGIASQLFGYAREGFSPSSMEGACVIILPETFASAICVTDGQVVEASAGEESQGFGPGSRVILAETQQVMRSGEVSVLSDDSSFEVEGFPSRFHAGIIAPLRVGNSCVGTLELYYHRQGEIDQRQIALASGFSDLLSAQLATFELQRQAETSARAELKALQSQVDPHFLFNTLGTIVSLIRTDPEKARSLIIDFSDYYRQTLGDSDQAVTVDQEVSQGMRYINLMQARYGETRLNISTSVEEEIAEALVPPFIVQPLLENSVKHGMPEVGTLHVGLRAFEIEDGIALEVLDDGVGMDEETLSLLFDPERRQRKRTGSHGAGLALTNVLSRIHFFFGPDSHIDVESAPGSGTKVTIVLLGEPRGTLVDEEEPHVERPDSR